jgi:predicted MFS family arabinose efflux permease
VKGPDGEAGDRAPGAVATGTVMTGPAVRLATRANFFVLGLAVAAWAPIVPYAKARVGADDATLGLMILCLGLGSLATMPISGRLVSLFGCRVVLPVAGILLCAVLPLLALARTPVELGAALALFGAAAGAIDIGINIQAVAVEKAERRPLMSGFHAQFSLGGIVGAAGATGLLALSLAPATALAILALACAFAILATTAGLLGRAEGGAAHSIALPRGPVILLGVMCFVTFLAEGSVLDWSALFITQQHGVDRAWGGLAYAAFSATMTIGRLTGDRIVARYGPRTVVAAGGLVAAVGYAVVILSPATAPSLIGFALIGAGAANIVPVLFTAAGRQPEIAPEVAVPGVATLGYLGLLIGPAAIGLIADAASLSMAFAVVALLLVGVAGAANRATR